MEEDVGYFMKGVELPNPHKYSPDLTPMKTISPSLCGWYKQFNEIKNLCANVERGVSHSVPQTACDKSTAKQSGP